MFHPYNLLCINYSIPIRWTFLYFLKLYVIFSISPPFTYFFLPSTYFFSSSTSLCQEGCILMSIRTCPSRRKDTSFKHLPPVANPITPCSYALSH